ncbi:MAG: AbrB family transcriptional regulator [Deltaproteobacteria bacterium CG23_combo_of_CG06-09_8_20_14_all_60_8]|nr:MAG: AbrB family transcriptional regulator [Deltaproteobacteria bacterium CG23_combo_of_CG06-09_8_20_14_all_60_8]
MLAKVTSKNQLTIPKAIMKLLPRVYCFDVEPRDGGVTMRPAQVSATDTETIRAKPEPARAC